MPKKRKSLVRNINLTQRIILKLQNTSKKDGASRQMNMSGVGFCTDCKEFKFTPPKKKYLNCKQCGNQMIYIYIKEMPTPKKIERMESIGRGMAVFGISMLFVTVIILGLMGFDQISRIKYLSFSWFIMGLGISLMLMAFKKHHNLVKKVILATHLPPPSDLPLINGIRTHTLMFGINGF
ncbi:MAG: hypothetical protein HWN65_15605 [Candidatus Helarchaeota archaeon]|nr:hypothetical protein [Candidatus Helarchaeota archaeon]